MIAETDMLTLWSDGTTVVANIITVLGFVAAAVGILLASRKFFRQKAYEQMTTLYSLSNSLYRAGLGIQAHRHPSAEQKKHNLGQVIDATNALKNWFHDNRFLFDDNPEVARLMKAVALESKQIAATGCMDRLMELRAYLESKLKKAP